MSDFALDLLAGLVLENGDRWGDVAAPFQWEDARAVLDLKAQPYHFMTRSRGGSKTGDLAGIAVAAMLAQAPPGARLYAIAADKDQGRLLLDSVDGYAARTPELRGAIEVGAYRVAAARTDALLEVLAADAPSAWGLRPWLLVADELAQWGTSGAPRRIWEATSSAVAKVDGARLVVSTTAGDPAHWARKVLDHALADPLWRVHEVRGPAPWIAVDRLAEQARRLTPQLFKRLFMNEWVAAEDRVASADDVHAALTLDGPLPPEPGLRYVVALDLGLKKDRTVAAVCHALPIYDEDERTLGARIVLDRMEVWQGSRERPVELALVEEWVAAASGSYNRAHVVADPWQAVGLAQRLRQRGIAVEEFAFSASSVGRLAGTLVQILRNRTLDLPADDDLADELVNLRLRETSPGVVRLDHDSDAHDDRAVTLALAATHLLEKHIGPLPVASSGVVGASLLGPAAESAFTGLGDASLGAFDRF
jgi:phage terminase large subunit-like protein